MKNLLLILTLYVMMLFLAMPATGQTNVAFGKVATQSSDGYPDSGKAYTAIDGNTDGNYFAWSVTHTIETGSSNPWWLVDLGSNYQMGDIKIWNRTDCCTERLDDFTVMVGNENGQTYNYGPYPSVGTTNPIVIPVNVTGRYVSVQIPRENAILSLAEVQVFGVPESQPTPQPTPYPTPQPTPYPTPRPTPQPPAILNAPEKSSPKMDYEFRTSNPSRGTAVLWWGRVSGATSYQVEVQKYRSADGTYVPTINTTSIAQTITLSTLSPGSYRWTVRSINANGVPGYEGGWWRFSIKYYVFGWSYREKNFWESDGARFLPFELLSFKNS